MSLLDKLNVLVWVNSLTGRDSKMGAFLQKFDGLKSVGGLLMIVAYYALPQFGIHVPDVVLKIGSGIAGVGLAHKLEKAVGLLSKGIDIAIKVLEVSKSVLATLSAKEEAPKA